MSAGPLISVIIPVYNLADSIESTIKSVINQSYRNLQVIIVNDGSSDGSSEICRAFMKTDHRITVIDKVNEGLCFARKTGISLATGEYIHHLDGGDTISPDTYSLLWSQLMNNDYPDILLFDFVYFNGKDSEIPDPYPPGLKSPVDYLLHIWTTQQYNCVWQYIHKRKLTDGFIFDKDINIGEDALYTSQLLLKATTIFHLGKPLLRYIVNEDSMSRSVYKEKQAKSILLYPDIIKSIVRKEKGSDIWEKELLTLKLLSYVNLIRNGYLDIFPEAVAVITEGVKRYPELKKIGLIKTIIKPISLYNISPILSDILIAYYRYKKK